MARPVDFKKKIEELRGYLIKYNGIPKQTENHAAHNNIKYYIKNHSDKPEIKALIDEFHLNDEKENKKIEKLQDRIEVIRAILEKYQRIPKNSKDYQSVYYFFNHYKDDPEVKKLMFIYVHADCFKMVTGRPLYVQRDYGLHSNCNFETSVTYVKYVYEKYKVLPARSTPPVKEIKKRIMGYKPVNDEEKYKLLEYFKYRYAFFMELSNRGCSDNELLRFLYIIKKND